MSSITHQEVLAMDLKAILAAVKDPKTSADMQRLMGDRGSGVATHVSKLMMEAQQREDAVDAQMARTIPPSTETLAAEAAVMAAEPVVEAPPVPAPPVPAVVESHEEEDKEFLVAGITVHRDAKGKPVRYTQEYQVATEDGRPIGRPTSLSARTLPELSVKQKEVHTQATRAFNRLKLQKTTFQQEAAKPVLTPAQIQEAVKKLLESKDEKGAVEAVEEVLKSKFSEQTAEINVQTEKARRSIIAAKFTANHPHDYNDCMANGKVMGDYMSAHRMEFTLDNLEAAFLALTSEEKLAPPEGYEQIEQVVVAANPAPAATVAAPATPVIPAAAPAVTVPASAAPAQPAATQVAPTVEATVTTPVAAPNVQPAARRPGVSGGIAPGTFSAERPGTPDPALARKDFLKYVNRMPPEEMKIKVKTDPQFVKQLESYGIRVR